MNSLAYQAFASGLLQKTITQQDIPSFKLNTATFQILVPKLYEMFPNTPMQVTFVCGKPPMLQVSPSVGCEADVDGVAAFQVVLANGTIVTAFELDLEMILDARFQVVKNASSPSANITGTVTYQNSSLSVKVQLLALHINVHCSLPLLEQLMYP
jgi:hypothetical protein